MRAALAGAALALALTAPARAGAALDNAVVAVASLPICNAEIFTDTEAAALVVVAAEVEGVPWRDLFPLVTQAADRLLYETQKRGTGAAFCQQVRRLAATMPRA